MEASHEWLRPSAVGKGGRIPFRLVSHISSIYWNLGGPASWSADLTVNPHQKKKVLICNSQQVILSHSRLADFRGVNISTVPDFKLPNEVTEYRLGKRYAQFTLVSHPSQVQYISGSSHRARSWAQCK